MLAIAPVTEVTVTPAPTTRTLCTSGTVPAWIVGTAVGPFDAGVGSVAAVGGASTPGGATAAAASVASEGAGSKGLAAVAVVVAVAVVAWARGAVGAVPVGGRTNEGIN